MGYFPICVDLRDRPVLLVGSGPQIEDKAGKLRPFGASIQRRADPVEVTLDDGVALVIVGDVDRADAARISRLCRDRRIPVNVVDDPQSSTFFFPALVTSGDVTISVSTGGKAPGAGAYLARMIRRILPGDLGERVRRLAVLRQALYAAHPREEAARLLREATARAFEKGEKE